MYNKLKIAAIVSLTLAMSVPVLGAENVKLNMDGVVLSTISPILEDDGVVMVDAKEIFNLLGGKMTLSSENDSVKIVKDDKTIEFIIGKPTAWLNGSKTGVEIPKAPYRSEDKTIYVPLKFIAEAFDGSMTLDKTTGTVMLTTEDENILVVKPATGKKLTFKDALNTATQNNFTLDDYEYTLEQIDKTTKSIAVEIGSGTNLKDDFPSYDRIRNTLFDSSITQEQTKYDTEIMKSSIEGNVRSYFSAIKMGEMSIALKEEEIKLAKKNLDAMSKKLELGLESQYNYDNKEKEYNQLTTTLDETKRALEAYNLSLSRLLSKTTVTTDYQIEYNIEYVPVKLAADINTHATMLVNIDPSIKKAQLEVEKAEFNFSNVGKDDADYDDVERAVDKAKRNVNDTINKLDETIKTTYTNLKNQENTYNKAVKDLETARKNYKLAKVKFNIGSISRLDLDNSKYAVMAAEVALQNAIYKYDNLKFTMKYPYLG